MSIYTNFWKFRDNIKCLIILWDENVDEAIMDVNHTKTIQII